MFMWQYKLQFYMFTDTDKKDANWLSNPSYQIFVPPPQVPAVSTVTQKISKGTFNQSDDDDVQPSTSHSSRSHKRKLKKDHKAKKEKQKVLPVLEFDGNEDYYVDKTAERGYLRVQTLHKPACPR